MTSKRLRTVCIAMMITGLTGSVIIASNYLWPKSAAAHALPAAPSQAPIYVGTVSCGAYDVLIIPHDDASASDAREAADNYRCPENLGTH